MESIIRRLGLIAGLCIIVGILTLTGISMVVFGIQWTGF